MSQYVSKSELIEYLLEHDDVVALSNFRRLVQSGRFDTPSKGIEEYYGLKEQYREVSQELERLRARVAELEDRKGDYFDRETGQGMSEWQMIDSAPRDGTCILVLNDDGCVYEVWWDEDILRFANADYHGCGCCRGYDDQPTHWMPLPDPPTQPEE